MIICRTCNRYMGTAMNHDTGQYDPELSYSMCNWCIERGYYYGERGEIRFKHIDDTPLAEQIGQEIADAIKKDLTSHA